MPPRHRSPSIFEVQSFCSTLSLFVLLLSITFTTYLYSDQKSLLSTISFVMSVSALLIIIFIISQPISRAIKKSSQSEKRKENWAELMLMKRERYYGRDDRRYPKRRREEKDMFYGSDEEVDSEYERAKLKAFVSPVRMSTRMDPRLLDSDVDYQKYQEERARQNQERTRSLSFRGENYNRETNYFRERQEHRARQAERDRNRKFFESVQTKKKRPTSFEDSNSDQEPGPVPTCFYKDHLLNKAKNRPFIDEKRQKHHKKRTQKPHPEDSLSQQYPRYPSVSLPLASKQYLKELNYHLYPQKVQKYQIQRFKTEYDEAVITHDMGLQKQKLDYLKLQPIPYQLQHLLNFKIFEALGYSQKQITNMFMHFKQDVRLAYQADRFTYTSLFDQLRALSTSMFGSLYQLSDPPKLLQELRRESHQYFLSQYATTELKRKTVKQKEWHLQMEKLRALTLKVRDEFAEENKLNKAKYYLRHIEKNYVYEERYEVFSFKEYVGDFYGKMKRGRKVVGYDEKREFLFVMREQKNHRYNLEETMLILILWNRKEVGDKVKTKKRLETDD